MKWRTKAIGTTAAVATTAAAALFAVNATAADHTDPPGRFDEGNAADIGDLYAWAADDTLSLVLTFAGPSTESEAVYSRDVLYGIHIDNDGDNVADEEILVRFGQDAEGNWGVQATGIPGEAEPLEGAVETMVDGTGAKLWAGFADDPFFFDLQGFEETLQSGTLSFSNERDSFAGANISTIVIDVPVTDALGAGTTLSIWATTAEI